MIGALQLTTRASTGGINETILLDERSRVEKERGVLSTLLHVGDPAIGARDQRSVRGEVEFGSTVGASDKVHSLAVDKTVHSIDAGVTVAHLQIERSRGGSHCLLQSSLCSLSDCGSDHLSSCRVV